MRYLTKLSFVLCLLCLVIVLSGCPARKPDFSNQTTWGDVTQKIMELEQEKANTMELLKK